MDVGDRARFGAELIDRQMEGRLLGGLQAAGIFDDCTVDLHQKIDLGVDIPQADAGRRDEGGIRAGNPDAQVSPGPADEPAIVRPPRKFGEFLPQADDFHFLIHGLFHSFFSSI